MAALIACFAKEPGIIKLRFDRGTLVLEGRGKDEHLPDSSDVWSWDHRLPAWRCAAMHYAAVRAALTAHYGNAWCDEVPAPSSVPWPRLNLPTLRAEQAQALSAWLAANCRGVVVMPTGTGKTEVALAAMAKLEVATLVVAPVRDLMYQWHRRISGSLGYDAGVIGDGLFQPKSVAVTTYDSAYIHMADLGARYGLLIFDEAHHLAGRCFREAAILSAAPRRLGLTATPERADGRESDLDWLIGPVVFCLEVRAVRGRTLADYEVVRIPVALSAQEQQAYDRAGERVRAFLVQRRRKHPHYTWQDVCRDARSDPEARQAHRAYLWRKSIEDRAAEKLRILEDIFRLHRDERILVFAGSNAMAIAVSRRFLVPALLNHSSKRERLAVLSDFAAGNLPVLVANQVLDEGIDVPEAKVAVILGGHASTRQAKQRLGRILRRSGERRAILYEVVCAETGEVERSRQRRQSEAFEEVRHRRLRSPAAEDS